MDARQSWVVGNIIRAIATLHNRPPRPLNEAQRRRLGELKRRIAEGKVQR